jgi:predicted DNA-binding protein YlxM (UPF0122 family)
MIIIFNLLFMYFKLNTSNQYNSLKWNYKNADWKGFTNACDIKFSCNMVSDNIQETNTTLTNYNSFPSVFAGYHVTVFYIIFLFLYNF